MSSVANPVTLSSFVEWGKTASKGWQVAHLHTTKGDKGKISMVMVILGDLLEDKVDRVE